MRKLTMILMGLCIMAVIAVDAAPRARKMKLGQSASMSDELAVMLPKTPEYTPGTVKSGDWTWVTTVTTNDNSTITVVSNGTNSKKKVTKDLCIVWYDTVVPMKWRDKFLTLTDEQKSNVLSTMPTDLDNAPAPAAVVLPVDTIGRDLAGDDKVTEEIYEIEIREE